MIIDEIILSDKIDIDPDEDTFKKITLEFSQQRKSNKQQKTFYLFDDKYLGIKENGSSRKEYWINLLFINTQAKHKKTIPWIFCFIALGLSIIASLLLCVVKFTDFIPLYPFALPIIILLFTSAALLVILTIHQSSSVIIYSSENGKIPVVELYHNNPSKDDIEQFTTQLNKRIDWVKNNINYDKPQLLPVELAEHRRLQEEGIISAAEYKIAKENIFKCH